MAHPEWLALEYAAAQHPQHLADHLLGISEECLTVSLEQEIQTIESVFGQSLLELHRLLAEQDQARLAHEQSGLQAQRAYGHDRERINQAISLLSKDDKWMEAIQRHALYQKSLADSLLLKLTLQLRQREARHYDPQRVAALLAKRRELRAQEQILDEQIAMAERNLNEYRSLGPEVAELALRHQALHDALQ